LHPCKSLEIALAPSDEQHSQFVSFHAKISKYRKEKTKTLQPAMDVAIDCTTSAFAKNLEVFCGSAALANGWRRYLAVG
jgi:hypothetical protein